MMAEREGSDFVLVLLFVNLISLNFPPRSRLLPLCNCGRIEENNL